MFIQRAGLRPRWSVKKHFRITTHDEQAINTGPVTFRLPPDGERDAYFGCARTFWNQRVLPSAANNFKPPIKSVVVKTTGVKRGIRLIVYASAKAYFDALIAEQSQEVAT